MNHELVTKIKELKTQGITDDEIIGQLSDVYPLHDIQECLLQLKDMRIVDTQSKPPDQTINKTRRILTAKNKWLVGIIILFSCLWLLAPLLLQQAEKRHANSIDSTLIKLFDVDRSYHAGRVINCVNQSPTQFGDFTGLNACNIVTAKVYYPKVAIDEYKATFYHEPGVPTVEMEDRIQYVDKDGNEIVNNIRFDYQQYRGNSDLVDMFGLTGYDHLAFSRLSGASNQSPQTNLNGWDWVSDKGWLGFVGPGSDLQDKITEKILADEPPAEGAPTASEAFSQNRAPIVVLSTLRYCHSPSVLLLDRLCILPN